MIIDEHGVITFRYGDAWFTLEKDGWDPIKRQFKNMPFCVENPEFKLIFDLINKARFVHFRMDEFYDFMDWFAEEYEHMMKSNLKGAVNETV